ncbi:MAG: SDR family NAD(P)-dependent oxidoreductase [Wenzhouxiangellaceae bacterium]|nr:SDR family NAD(P)-dependent oxidoreductase [Wenzhouxiangellaceae bacterium]
MQSEKTVLITGAGSGLGEAMAQRLAGAGWRVFVTDQHAERAERVRAALPGAGHLDAALDVTDDTAWQETVARIDTEFGRLDALINNAGVATGGQLGETSLDDWQWVLEINLMGVVRGCHHLVGRFREQGSGHIVNVASWAGLAAAPAIVAYGTAKAGVVAFSEMLRAELAPVGVEVSVLCPAFVPTRLTETMRAPDPSYAERVQKWMERSGITAEDVAGIVHEALERPRFLLLTHPETRWHYRIKRYAPERYFRLLLKQMSKLMRGR